MKSFDLNAYGVQEMAYDEMLSIEGGNIFIDTWNCVVKVAEDAWSWMNSEEAQKLIDAILDFIPGIIGGIIRTAWREYRDGVKSSYEQGFSLTGDMLFA
jgi:hypothetical protein